MPLLENDNVLLGNKMEAEGAEKREKGSEGGICLKRG